MLKRLFGFALCLCLLFALAVPVSASTGNARLLEYQHIDTVTANITMDQFWGIANCDGSITANGDHPVYVEVYLQRYTNGTWETLRCWSGEGQGYAYANGSCAVEKGYTYRTYTAGYVYDGSTIIDIGHAIFGANYF